MKRMNEVFELPLAGEELQGEPYLSDVNCYLASFDDELTYEDGRGMERAQHAAHAINHVDQLADALQNLLDAVGKQSHALSAEDFLAVDAGLLALHNYRGGE